jgi:anaerobic ribonucleoside-triphosphate reductase activating protein
MRYALIREMDVTNGNNIGISIFVQGCNFHCKGCFNPETWDYDGGKLFTDKTFDKIIEISNKPYIKRLSVLGGEPLSDKNIIDMYSFLESYKKIFPNKEIWLYSGYKFEEIKSNSNKNRILQYIDILIDGQFVEELKDLSLYYRGSSNQRVIDVNESLQQNKIIEYI